MNSAATQSPLRWVAPGLPALEPDEQVLLADEARYCPTQLLSAFALLMAGHGRAVCTSMMLGDREYALWQLASAHTLHDPQLREIAARLFAYFDDARAPAPVRIRS
jgi:hypothetical protein